MHPVIRASWVVYITDMPRKIFPNWYTIKYIWFISYAKLQIVCHLMVVFFYSLRNCEYMLFYLSLFLWNCDLTGLVGWCGSACLRWQYYCTRGINGSLCGIPEAIEKVLNLICSSGQSFKWLRMIQSLLLQKMRLSKYRHSPVSAGKDAHHSDGAMSEWNWKSRLVVFLT